MGESWDALCAICSERPCIKATSLPSMKRVFRWLWASTRELRAEGRDTKKSNMGDFPLRIAKIAYTSTLPLRPQSDGTPRHLRNEKKKEDISRPTTPITMVIIRMTYGYRDHSAAFRVKITCTLGPLLRRSRFGKKKKEPFLTWLDDNPLRVNLVESVR